MTPRIATHMKPDIAALVTLSLTSHFPGTWWILAELWRHAASTFLHPDRRFIAQDMPEMEFRPSDV